MWTMCWTDAYGNNHWDRFESVEEVLEICQEVGISPDDDDTIIFMPEADECMTSPYWITHTED